MANMRIVTENFSDSSVLAATPPGSTNISNLQDISRSKVFRSSTYISTAQNDVGINLVDFYIREDGLKLYILYTSGDFYQYNLSRAFDISTKNSLVIKTITHGGALDSFTISADGTRVYFNEGASPYLVYQYDLTVAWNLDTMVYDSPSPSAIVGAGGIEFTSDGLNLIASSSSFDTIKNYSVSIAWDLSSTLTTHSSFFSVSSHTGSFPTGSSISSDGKTLFLSANTAEELYSFSLTNAFDLSTVSIPSLITVDISSFGLGVNGIGNKLNIYNDGKYILSGDTGAIDYITILSSPIAWDISSTLSLGAVQSITGNILPGKDISTVVLGRHNLEESTQVTVELFSDNNNTGTSLSLVTRTVTTLEAGSNITPWGSFVYGGIPWGFNEIIEKNTLAFWYTTDIVGVKSFLISINPIPSHEIDIGRLYIGKYIEPTTGISYGYSLENKENTKQYRTEGGTLRSDFSDTYRNLVFDLNTINETDRSLLHNAMSSIGKRKDFFISLFPDDLNATKEVDHSGMFKLTKTPRTTEFIQNYYKSKYEMEEV